MNVAMKNNFEKILSYNVVQLHYYLDKCRPVVIKEFDNEKDAQNYLDCLHKFRPSELFEIRESVKMINNKPSIGFFKRMKMVEEIKEEIKRLENDQLNKDVILLRLQQLINILD